MNCFNISFDKKKCLNVRISAETVKLCLFGAKWSRKSDSSSWNVKLTLTLFVIRYFVTLASDFIFIWQLYYAWLSCVVFPKMSRGFLSNSLIKCAKMCYFIIEVKLNTQKGYSTSCNQTASFALEIFFWGRPWIYLSSPVWLQYIILRLKRLRSSKF